MTTLGKVSWTMWQVGRDLVLGGSNGIGLDVFCCHVKQKRIVRCFQRFEARGILFLYHKGWTTWKGGRESTTVSHLQFANNIIFFLIARRINFQHLMILLKCKTNLSRKSHGRINVARDRAGFLATLVGHVVVEHLPYAEICLVARFFCVWMHVCVGLGSEGIQNWVDISLRKRALVNKWLWCIILLGRRFWTSHDTILVVFNSGTQYWPNIEQDG